jgi:hypothetical protein
MMLCPNSGSHDRRSAYPGKNDPPAGLPDSNEILRVHWSGFACSREQPVGELEAYYLPRLEQSEGNSVRGDEMLRFRRFQSRTGWRKWPRYVDIAHVLHPYGFPDADTAGVGAVLDDKGKSSGTSSTSKTLSFTEPRRTP